MRWTQASDEVLVGALSTDAEAFTEFYLRHLARVRAVGARRLGSAEDVADLIATVFLKVIESADTFDPGRGRAVPWLHAIAVNAVEDQFRQRGRASQAVARLQGRRYWAEDDLARLVEQLDAESRSRGLFTAMQQLPPAERRLLELVVLDDLTLPEAAAALNLRTATARMRLSRARRRVRAHLDAPGSTPDRGAGPSRDLATPRVKEQTP